MSVVVNSDIKKKFIKLFDDYNDNGYEELVEFFGDQVGFSVKKRYSNSEDITLLKIALIDDPEAKSNLFIDAIYGKLNDNSNAVVIRNSDDIKLSDPIDVKEIGDYSYDVDENCVLKHGEKISGLQAINEVYEKHIKPTRKYGGALLRLRLWYWRKLLPRCFNILSRLLTAVLFIVAGIKYKYDPFFGEELFDQLKPKTTNKTPIKESATKPIEFLGFEVNRWTIVFYCLLHLSLFFIFYIFNLHATYLSRIITNNFLLSVYVVVSLWFIETFVPLVLTKAVKYLTARAFSLEFKKIEI